MIPVVLFNKTTCVMILVKVNPLLSSGWYLVIVAKGGCLVDLRTNMDIPPVIK